MPDEVVVLVESLVAARRQELEPAVDLGRQTVEIKARAEDVAVLDLQGGGPVAETRLIPGGLRRAQRAGAEAGLVLFVVPGEEGGGVGGGELAVELDVPGFLIGVVLVVVEGQQVDLRLGVGAPNPQVIAQQRAAELDARVLHAVDAVARREGRLGVEVVPRVGRREVLLVEVQPRHEVLVGVEEAPRGAPVVGAAPGDHVDHDAPGGDVGVAAAGRHLDVLERVEVEVARGGADGGHVGDDHAVERPHRLAVHRSWPDEARLLAAVVAADVDAVEEDPGHGGQERPGVAGGGDFFELGVRDVGAGRDPPLVEEGRLRGHRDALLDRRRQDDRHLGVVPDVDLDLRVFHGREPPERHDQAVASRRQADEAERAGGVGLLLLGRAAAGQDHRRAGERMPLVVGDGAVEIAGLELRDDGCREQDREQRDRRGRQGDRRPPRSSHLVSSNAKALWDRKQRTIPLTRRSALHHLLSQRYGRGLRKRRATDRPRGLDGEMSSKPVGLVPCELLRPAGPN